ncbi:hypothetical protein [uncultured phage MedDCM-OCT-S08-C495]|nr:hypothetical protein [uncultured phage MedDCM-OCT-S08-C495]|tara:strand:- start:375 stop:647 length:273 start_codon:yes stop_codon:yes gene_type:complete
MANLNRPTNYMNIVDSVITLAGTYATKRQAIVALIQEDMIDDANDLIKYQAICDTYERVVRDLVRTYNDDTYSVEIDVELMLSSKRRLGG